MEAPRLCAYNQTRECFLGLEVAAADLSFADLKGLLGKLVLESGEGIWMSPFRGIPDSNLRAPLDLVYLDEDCLVIEVVESFPTFHVTPSSPRASSVLALPTHSIYTSQTQAGDQLVLCAAEEMQDRLERFSSSGTPSGGAQGAVQVRGKQLWSNGPSIVQLENSSELEVKRPSSGTALGVKVIEPGRKNAPQTKSWLMRLWSPEPKKTPDQRLSSRESCPGLSAFYWTGAAPKAHWVRNISGTGLYVVTEERWYPGTVVLMTLQQTADEAEIAENSISVHSRAVRWGSDGVGLQFIPQDAPAAQSGLNKLEHGANRRDLDLFLGRLRIHAEQR